LNRVVTWFTVALALAGLVSIGAAPARSLSVSRRGDLVRVRTAGVEFITGTALARLKDGRALRLELDLSLAFEQAGPYVAQAQPRFGVSYDLWEERFAVTRTDTPRSLSHVTARDAEAWCLDQMAIPVAAISSRTPSGPFWLRLSYHLTDEERQTADADGAGLTLRGLIDRLSRRQAADTWSDTIVSGPLRLD
jgi:hypothetical protein